MRPICTALLAEIALVTGAASGAAPGNAAIQRRCGELVESIPADVMAVYIGRPQPAEQPSTSALDLLVGAAQLAAQMGKLAPHGCILADVGGCLPILGKHPHAIVLMDITARPLGRGSYRLNDLQAGVVLSTNGDNEAVVNRIRQLLARYTNSQFSKLERIACAKDQYYRLTDSRLPAWAVCEWGAVDGLFAVTVGTGAFERILSAHRGRPAPSTTSTTALTQAHGLEATASRPDELALADEPWFAKAHQACKGTNAAVEWTIDFRRIQQRLAGVMRGRPQEVIEAINAAHVHRGLWTIGTQGRAIVSYGMMGLGQDDVLVPVSDPAGFKAEHLAAVPPEAGHFAILRIPVAEWILNGRAGYLASQRSGKRELLRQRWADLERRLGIDTRRQLLDHLGEHVIIHTYPRHPLAVPLLCTILIEIKDEPTSVRAGMDALLSACQKYLAELVAQDPAAGFVPQLARRDDGIWFVQAGIFIGPALAVTDRWIVVSFSPTAVRANLDHIARIPSGGG